MKVHVALTQPLSYFVGIQQTACWPYFSAAPASLPGCWSGWETLLLFACPQTPPLPTLLAQLNPLSHCLVLWTQRHLSASRFAPHCPGPSPNLWLIKQQHSCFSSCHRIPNHFGHWLFLQQFVFLHRLWFGKEKKYETINTNNNSAKFKYCRICSVVSILEGLVTKFLKNTSLPMMFSRALYASKHWNSKTSFLKPLQYLIIFCFRKQIFHNLSYEDGFHVAVPWSHFSCLLQEKKEGRHSVIAVLLDPKGLCRLL